MSFCLRVKSQVIFMVQPLATHSNFIFLHFSIANFVLAKMVYFSNRTDLPYFPYERLAEASIFCLEYCSQVPAQLINHLLQVPTQRLFCWGQPPLGKKIGMPTPTQHALLISEYFIFPTALTYHHLIGIYSFICLLYFSLQQKVKSKGAGIFLLLLAVVNLYMWNMC